MNSRTTATTAPASNKPHASDHASLGTRKSTAVRANQRETEASPCTVQLAPAWRFSPTLKRASARLRAGPADGSTVEAASTAACAAASALAVTGLEGAEALPPSRDGDARAPSVEVAPDGAERWASLSWWSRDLV